MLCIGTRSFHITRKEAKSLRDQLNRFDLDGRLVSVKTHRRVVNRLRKAFNMVTANPICIRTRRGNPSSFLRFECSKDEFDKACEHINSSHRL